MTSGDEIRRARERAGLTQEHLASRVGVTLRTVGNWERGATVPRNRLAAVQSALAGYLDDAGDEPGLRGASDVELLAEIARRLARTYSGEEAKDDGRDPAPKNPAGSAPAPRRMRTTFRTGDAAAERSREGSTQQPPRGRPERSPGE